MGVYLNDADAKVIMENCIINGFFASGDADFVAVRSNTCSTLDIYSSILCGNHTGIDVVAGTVNLYAGGRLGIGADPLDKLHINDGTLRISGTTAQAIYVYGAATVKPYIDINEYGISDYYIVAGTSSAGVLSI
jgi:hypothetical protein